MKKEVNYLDYIGGDKKYLSHKNRYDYDEREIILAFSNRFSNITLKRTLDYKQAVKEEELIENFFKTLKVFDSKVIIEVFKDIINRVKVIRNKEVSKGLGSIAEINSKRKGKQRYVMLLPTGPLCLVDQMTFSHEIGHVPEMDIPRKSYYEYSEAIPIFMEYLVELNRHKDKEKALHHFLMYRAPYEQKEAKRIVQVANRCNLPRLKSHLKYLEDFVEDYYYVESLEYALQLADRLHEDKKSFSKEFENILYGKSLIDTADTLEIDTNGCKKLMKESKRLSRR